MTNQPPMAGQPALATVELVFRVPGPDGVFNTPDDIGAPLPDDRFTLIVNDDIIDLAGNHLDGESNASEPQEFPTFPSGDGLPGGDFIARFTIDSRPEIGNFSAGTRLHRYQRQSASSIRRAIDDDYTNRDLSFQIGTVSDSLFAGKFEPAALDAERQRRLRQARRLRLRQLRQGIPLPARLRSRRRFRSADRQRLPGQRHCRGGRLCSHPSGRRNRPVRRRELVSGHRTATTNCSI